jgi:phenylalanyl-tRNA synthetase beta chain
MIDKDKIIFLQRKANDIRISIIEMLVEAGSGHTAGPLGMADIFTAEEIETLDGKKHILQGGDIVADDGKGRIVDLLGVMGLKNSVVTEQTKRILFFIDNNNPIRMRKTSMSLGIRSEAAQLNEKGVDPELAYDALLFGIKLYEEHADGKATRMISNQ